MKTLPNRRLAVYGAAGHTGRFVVAELRRRGWDPILSGRDAAKLAEVAAVSAGAECRVATVDDAAALDLLLADAAAVLNCAGPFAETAPALIEAAFRAGLPYLDVTGESLVAMSVFEQFAEQARERQTVVLPAMGFFGGLGDLLATAAMADWPEADEIGLAVALDSWKPTQGTRNAGARRAGRRVVFRAGKLEILPAEPPPPTGTHDFPPPFGRQDVIGELTTVDVVTISRHLATRDITACLNTTPLTDLRDPNAGGPVAADGSGRSAQQFMVDVSVRRGAEVRRLTARGRDIYAITAPIVVEALERILDGRTRTTGVVAAGELFDAPDFLKALEPWVTLG